jgi:hypothetical protein
VTTTLESSPGGGPPVDVRVIESVGTSGGGGGSEDGGSEITRIQPPISSFAVSGTTAKSSQLPVGRYELTASIDLHFRLAATGGAALTSDPLYFEGERLFFEVTDTAFNGFLHAITEGGSGTVWVMRADEPIAVHAAAAAATATYTARAATVTMGTVSVNVPSLIAHAGALAATVTPGKIDVAVGVSGVTAGAAAATIEPYMDVVGVTAEAKAATVTPGVVGVDVRTGVSHAGTLPATVTIS